MVSFWVLVVNVVVLEEKWRDMRDYVFLEPSGRFDEGPQSFDYLWFRQQRRDVERSEVASAFRGFVEGLAEWLRHGALQEVGRFDLDTKPDAKLRQNTRKGGSKLTTDLEATTLVLGTTLRDTTVISDNFSRIQPAILSLTSLEFGGYGTPEYHCDVAVLWKEYDDNEYGSIWNISIVKQQAQLGQRDLDATKYWEASQNLLG
ncbi:hypothetical protein B0H16DRAFT_1461794 [Mycena metata]|uniref:Uncharacterized protein n=1 Tax=Mycena metata TaxID=1033252 RepID=A0AAD7IRL5_9AGAR|nr:hypothetical protein B0H16DRAFT_1461794 [Mycena metata]